MSNFIRIIFLCFFCCQSFAEIIKTFYGEVDIDEPVLLDLIHSPAFLRLKHIHQYGVSYYVNYKEEFNRYEHSLGVFHLLRSQGCSLEEQIAGLLHDASHTVFSHVGDWIFNVENQETDYQNLTHIDYLHKSGLGKILQQYGFNPEKFLPTKEAFPALEQPLPNLCADRLDYNVQGAVHQNFITHEEAQKIFNDLRFEHGAWISNEHEILKKLVHFSIFMSENCWGSNDNYVLSKWLAQSILKGLEINIITMEDIRFGMDNKVWKVLQESSDSFIKKHMAMLTHYKNHYCIVSKQEADIFIENKFRGINPVVYHQEKLTRLLSLDPDLENNFNQVKARMALGAGIKFINN